LNRLAKIGSIFRIEDVERQVTSTHGNLPIFPAASDQAAFFYRFIHKPLTFDL